MNRNSQSITHPKFLLILTFILNGMLSYSQTAFNMSNSDYSCNFSDVAAWSNNFSSGNGTANWLSVGINATGTIPDGTKTTVSSSTFSSGTSGGIQKGNGSIQLLSTGSTAFGNAVAVDLYFNFTNRIAGTLSFDYECIFNATGDRGSSLKVYTSIDGLTWSELGINTISVVNNVSSSGSVLAFILPSSFNNSSNARIRFYQFSNDVGTTGSRAKISIDNISVTSTSPAAQQEINIKQNQTIITNNTFYSFQNQNIGTSSNPIEFTIENLGLAHLTLSTGTKINISGADATSFAANESATLDTILAMGYTTFTVIFNPLTAGNKSAVLSISNNDGDEQPFIINISGIALQATLSTDYFRSKQSGNWNSINTWESSSDNANWINATLTPDYNANTIAIKNNHVVTITSTTSYDQLTVEAGAHVTIAAGVAHTLNNGTGADLTINGTWENTGSTWTTTGASWLINDGGTYIHNTTSAIATPLNAATLSAASNFIYRGSSTLNPTISTSGRTYGNLSFESSSGTWNVSTSGTNPLTIKGNFTIGNNVIYATTQTGLITIEGNLTNNGSMINGSNNQSYLFNGNNKTIGGNSSVTFNQLTINTASSITIITPTIVTSGLNLNNGTLSLDSSSLTLNQSPNQTTGNIDPSNGTIIFTNSTPIIFSSLYISGGIKNLTNNSSSSITLSDSTAITGVLTLTNGTFNANNHLTLTSSASIVYQGGTITNYSISETLNNLTLANGTISLSENLTLLGSLNLVDAIIDFGNKSITINGNVTRKTGTIRSSGGTLTLLGTEHDTLYFDQTNSGITNQLKDLNINKANAAIHLGNSVIITDNGTVNITAGTLASNGHLKLISTANGTGRIAELTTGANITGNVEIQRYMVGGAASQRGWRYMSSPVTNTTYAQLIDDIFITGPGGATNGFDAAGSSSSLMTYEESTSRGWKNISSPSNNWPSGKGAIVFFRGDRTQTSSITNTSVSPNSFALDYIGNINSGNVIVNLDYNNTIGLAVDQGWNLTGNPYPSQIDWDLVTKTSGVNSHYYLVNPNTKNYLSANTGVIAIGQGFFVQVNAPGQSITFEENDKTSTNGTAYFKSGSEPLIIKMNLDSVQHDLVKIFFVNNADRNYLFSEDAIKLTNSVYNISVVTPNNIDVQNNYVPTLSSSGSDTFELKVTSTTNTTYRLSFENFSQIHPTKAVLLVDKQNNSITNLRISPNYQFAINNNQSNSFGNRFLLVITNQNNPLPLKLAEFIGIRNSTENILKWTTSSEKNILGFEVQKSPNGIDFETIGLVEAKNQNTTTQYSFKDKQISSYKNYYRLKINNNNKSDYSNIVVLNTEDFAKKNVIQVHPNPAQNKLNIITYEESTIGTICIFNLHGKVIQCLNGINQIDINDLVIGHYILQVEINGIITRAKFSKQAD